MDRSDLHFVKIFGRMLLPEGFFLWNASFYRIDPASELIWIVAPERNDRGEIQGARFAVKALCHGLNAEALEGGLHSLGVLFRCSGMQFDMSRFSVDCPYVINASGKVFRKLLLERFVGIRDLPDFQAFREWHYQLLGGPPDYVYWLPQEVWECVQLEQYDRGRELNRLAYDRLQEICQESPEMLGRPSVKARNEAYLALDRLFAEGDVATLQRHLKERVEASRVAIRRYFQQSDIV